MDSWPSAENSAQNVAPENRVPRLARDKTVKIRMDPLEIRELDAVAKSLGYSERATALRWLVRHHGDISRAAALVTRYELMQAARAEFENQLGKK